ncbi:hypothetical protein DITRI_Ditri09bG0014300 [Diplodiscus trichospermus]
MVLLLWQSNFSISSFPSAYCSEIWPPLIFLAPSKMSLLFWVAFTRSISSMPDNPL